MSLNRAVILQNIIDNLDVDPSDAKHVFDQLIDEITEELGNRESVKLVNFGTFLVSHSPARIARNPKTKEPAMVEAHWRISFKVSTLLKARVASARKSAKISSPEET